MKHLLIALVLLLALPAAMADQLFADAGTGVRIEFHDGPCLDLETSVQLLLEGAKSQPKAVTATVRGVPIPRMCWALDSAGDYMVLDQDGEGVDILKQGVHPMPGS